MSPKFGIDPALQIDQLPPIPKYTRIPFLITRVLRILWYAFLADVAGTYCDLNPIYALTGSNMRSLRSQGPILTVVNVVARITISYATINMLYDFLGLFMVGLGFSEPKRWPTPFGKWRDSYTIRRFWG